MPGPSGQNRNRLRRSSTIQIDNFLHDEEDKQKFKAPKFQPLSTRYKQREEKKLREEEEKFRQLQIKLKKKKEKEAVEAALASAPPPPPPQNDDIEPETEKAMKKAEIEKVIIKLRLRSMVKV